ncbi:MAG: FKBP-type peptidyl-prolyl cis-trans isomerase [Gammaproteobacteria bacterium]|jgi:FKBP-type peptidyl-prolyl cis-trans isomerase FklB
MQQQLFKITLLVSLVQGTVCAQEALNLERETDRLSYSLGHQVGTDFQGQGVELNAALLRRGIEDGLAGAEPLLEPEAMQGLLLEFKQGIVEEQRQQLRQRVESRRAEVQRKREAGEAFLMANRKEPGVKTLPSGLQYRVIKPGNGKTPQRMDTVTVHYRGTRIDGSEFDSSYVEDAPATFRVDQVISGWAEALQLMQEGAKWELYLPPKLGFGRTGPMADETLIYEIELLAVGESGEAREKAPPKAGSD